MRKLLTLGMVLLLFSACSTEQDSMQQERSPGGTVTFEEFKSATGLQNFSKTIRIPKKANSIMARAATMEDFIIDTDFIHRTIIDHKITYSFSIEPKVIKDGKTLYNLIVYHNNGDWQYAIMEMKPTAAKFQNLVLGQQVKLDGEIAEIYHTDVARGVDCVMFSIEDRHCTMQAPWCTPTHCDDCNLCVDFTNFKVCREDSEDYNIATLVATDNDYGSGGGNVVHDDFVFVPNFGPGNIRAIRTERSAMFYEALSPEQQSWAEGHADLYNQYVNYCLDDYTQATLSFAYDLISQSMESGFELNIEKSMKSPENIDDSDIDSDTEEGRKFKCIYEKLTQSPSFQRLIIATFGDNERLNIKFEISDSIIPHGTCGLLPVDNSGSQPKYNNLITIKKSILQNTCSDIYVAKVILHEMIHAYLNIKLKDCDAGATLPFINNLELDQLINEFYQDFNCQIDFEESPQSQHAFMFDHMLPASTTILSEILNSLVSSYHQDQMQTNPYSQFYNSETHQNEPFNWTDLYNSLMLDGLHNTETFQQTIGTDSVMHQRFNHYSQIARYSLTKDCN